VPLPEQPRWPDGIDLVLLIAIGKATYCLPPPQLSGKRTRGPSTGAGDVVRPAACLRGRYSGSIAPRAALAPRGRADNTVASLGFRLVEGCIGDRNRGLDMPAGLKGGHSDADREPATRPSGRKRDLADPPPDPLGNLLSLERIDKGQEDAEFLSAKARDDTRVAHAVREPIGDQPQGLIAGRMAIHVIHGLEVIDVDHQEAAVGIADRCQLREKCLSMEEPGHRIPGGLLVEVAVRLFEGGQCVRKGAPLREQEHRDRKAGGERNEHACNHDGKFVATVHLAPDGIGRDLRERDHRDRDQRGTCNDPSHARLRRFAEG